MDQLENLCGQVGASVWSSRRILVDQLENLCGPVGVSVFTCVSSWHSQKCITLLNLMTELIFFSFFS